MAFAKHRVGYQPWGQGTGAPRMAQGLSNSEMTFQSKSLTCSQQEQYVLYVLKGKQHFQIPCLLAGGLWPCHRLCTSW